jgi:hypothetical protein
LRRIIVTADDFGVAREVNDAVEDAHREGVLTAASLMVGAPEAADEVARTRRLPLLCLGLHLVLAEGGPILPPSRVPDLVDRSGAFCTDMSRAGAPIFFHIPPHAVVEPVIVHRKPPEVKIWRLRNQSCVGTVPRTVEIIG